MPEDSTISVTPDELRPVSGKERLASVDVLRGFALLGILWMNIIGFAFPLAVYTNPMLMGGFEGADWWQWVISHLFFDQKFMTIFSMLFGAGLILMSKRMPSGLQLARVHYRRCFWLLLIGMLHAYLLWWGDILFFYAVCGFFILPLRKLKPSALALTGLAVLLIPLPIAYGYGHVLEQTRQRAQAAQSRIDSGGQPSPEDEEALQEWKDSPAEMGSSPEELQKDIEIHRGGYLQLVLHRTPKVMEMQVSNTLTFALWRAGGLMLLGMAFMKWGVFSASLPNGAYWRMLAAGYGLGLPLGAFSAYELIGHRFEMVYFLRFGLIPNWFASILVAFGHTAALMLLCKSGAVQGLLNRLAAVGRTAFSNYLLQSLICTTLFYGYALGWYARFSRSELVLVVLAAWAVQLAVSPVWMRHFRFGPAEWVWRSLTYSKAQPFIRQR